MYLKSLEISGFKSFGKKTSLVFNTPITSVVGPNGSGKSNVAEAFRFVLGEQSLKSMRGKRGEDLIWNGGSSGAKSNRASVKITFDNSKRIFNVDFDEVSIERVVYRDSVSEYLINGTQVRLKDVAELLAVAHIGSSGHHIISQGEADHILIASPRERREMIEDALGLKIYQYKKKESERKLEKTKENINQVESLRKEIAPHLRFLKKQVEKIEKTLSLKEELKNLYREYLRREYLYIEAKNDEINTELALPKEKLKDLEKKLSEAKKTLEDAPGLDEKRKSLLKVESELNDVRNKKDSKARDIGRIEGEISSLTRIIEKIKEQKISEGNVSVPLHKIKEVSSFVENEINNSQNSNDGNLLLSIINKIREALKNLIESYKNTDSSEIDNYENEIKDLKQKKADAEQEIVSLKKEEENLYIKYNEIKDSIESEKDKNREAEKALFQLMAEQKETYATLSLIKDRESRLAILRDELDREIKEGVMLVGREVFEFTKQDFVKEGVTLDKNLALSEDRKTQEERIRAIQKIKMKIEDAGAGGGDDVMKEFKEVSERDGFLEKELADLNNSSASLVQMIKELDEKLSTEFETGVLKINSQFESFFNLMFGGGRASIKVVKEQKIRRVTEENEDGEIDNILPQEEEEKPESGIEIDVKLPKKNIKGLEMLSGGERALTSIALLFAISQVNPPPFIILDETDAALDEANSKKYGDMISNLSNLSQLILITHNRETMSRAGVLYGITMGSDGLSKLLSVAFEEAVAVAK